MRKGQRGGRPAVALARQGALPLAFGLALATLGNVISALPERVRDEGDWALMGVKLVLLALALLWAVGWAHLGLRDIGFGEEGWWRHALLGVGVGAAVIAPVAAYLLFPLGLPGGEVGYEEVEELGVGSFLLWALVRQPLATSLFEETMFRGILQALAIRAWGPMAGVGWVAVSFALWHLVINYQTIQETAVGDDFPLFVLAQLAALAGVTAGSLMLSLLRLRTGGLAAPIGFHWAVVVAMQGALFASS